MAVLQLPNAAQLASYTTAVAENNRLRLAGTAPDNAREAARNAPPAAIPARSGEPSKIEHVVFVIKENRTYDQVLGDMGKGNGDPSLVMFGADVTPNQHRLAEQFVLLDNFYATGGNSADGHQWITQANETEYCLWPGYQGRSYPYDGSDPMAYSSGGFLWNYAQARGRSVRVYGEFAGRMNTPPSARVDLLRKWEKGGDFTADWKIRAPIASLNAIVAANYPAYSTSIPDVARAQIFLADLKRFESEGKLPNLMLVQLPSNHTFGTTPGVIDTEGDGGGQRPGGGADRGGVEPFRILAEDGDLHRGGRRAEWRGSRGWTPHDGVRGQPVCAARAHRFHLLFAPEHAEIDRADSRIADDVVVRSDRERHAQ